MKKVISILLAIVMLFTCSLPAIAEGAVFSIKLIGTVDTSTKFDGRDTFVFDWQFCANEANVSLTNAQGLRIAYDNTVLQLIRWNASLAIDDSSLGATELTVVGQTANAGVYPYNARVFAGKNNTGETGYLSMTVSDAYEIYECTSGAYESILQLRFVFREGKSEADLNSGSIRLMTIPELNAFAQSTAMLINSCTGQDTGTLVSYEYLLHEDGTWKDSDTLTPPTLSYPGYTADLNVAAPTADPPTGAVLVGSTVTLFCTTTGATVYYTTDGNDPTSGSQEYTSTITISLPLTIKAIAVKSGMADSNIATFEYTTYKAAQTTPEAPALASKTTTSITLTAISGAEYRLGSSGVWQTSPTFSDLDPNTDYVFYSRLAETSTHEASSASEVSAAITTEKATLSGAVTITGTAKFGAELTAVTTGLTTTPAGADKGTLTYQWKRGSAD